MKGCSEFVVVDGFLFQIWQLYHVPVVASLTSPPYAFLQVQRQILMRAEEGSIVTTNA